MRLKFLALIAVALLALAGLTTANAAGLNLQSSDVTVNTGQACTANPIPLTRTDAILGGLFGYRSVRLTIPASCAGHSLHITVYRPSDGSVIGTGSAAPLPTGNVTVAISNIYGFLGASHAFALTIDGWHVPVQVN